MDKLEIQKFIGTDKLTVSEVMQKIDINTMGILFLVDKNERLIGCITDGDVRRYLLSGGKMENLAVHAANKEPRYARTIDEAKHLYHSKNFIIIPVVNNVMSIIDLYTGEKDRKTKKHRSPLNIPVVINAGGKGTRLDPFTRVLPKPLIPVGELPIIELIMQEYKTYSCEDFHIIVN